MPINEADTCRTYVVPKLYNAGWEDTQISEQKSFTDGRIMLAAIAPFAARRNAPITCFVTAAIFPSQ